MPSAILMMYTSAGFLIAADGRMRIDGIVRSDTVTKIFQISEPSRSLAYAFGGTVGLTDKDNSELILFDFRDEALKAIESLKMSRHGDLASYTKNFAKRLYRGLVKAQEGGRIEVSKEGENPTEATLLACLFVAGYYGNIPSWTVVQFLREKETLLPPVIRLLPLSKGYEPSVTYGSEKVGHMLFRTDYPDFARYRVPRVNAPDDVTLAEVQAVANNYMLACSDPAAMRIDGEHCAAIGGHIHMAKITPTNGFEWVVSPKDSPCHGINKRGVIAL